MTEWLFIRHGVAMDPEAAETRGIRELERPLTEKGRRRTRLAAAGLARLIRPQRFLTSPLRRARETAELFARAFDPSPPVEVVDWLAPGGLAQALFSNLAARRDHPCLALVGHEPDLSAALAQALCGHANARLEMKKAACALVRFAGPPAPGAGELVWLLPPRVLRALGGER